MWQRSRSEARRSGRLSRGLALALGLWSLACSGEAPLGGGGPSAASDSLTDNPGLLISEPLPASAAEGFRRVSWVALAEGTAPTGFTAHVRVSSGASFRRPVINGGFDPAPLAALVGDTVVVTVTDPRGRVVDTWEASVKGRRPPVIVRTEPPPRKRDVPLNMSLLVVFSEPVDPATVSDRTVRLFNRNGLALAGQVRLDPDGLHAFFQPSGPLHPNSNYTFDITAGVMGLSGEPLATPQQVGFTTGDESTGFLRVITTTTGVSPNADGYRVVVDGDTTRALQVWAPDTLSMSIGAGSHTVGFMGDAPDCVVMAPSWTGSVEAMNTTTVRVPINCGDGSRTGLAVEVSASGVDLDNDYFLTLCQSVGCGTTGSHWTWVGVVMLDAIRVVETPAGTYHFKLAGVAPNCTGPTSGSVTVVEGQLTMLRTEMVCSPTAKLRVTASTSGPGISQSYLVGVDGLSYMSLSGGSSATLSLSPGSHRVSLGVPFTCSVAGAAQLDVDLAPGTTTDLVFDVTCQVAGTLLVWAPTGGSSLDDAYQVSLDGFYRGTVLANSYTTLAVAAGTHSVGLGGIAPNCAVSGPNPVVTSVDWGETKTLSLPVACVPSP